jgi:pimeloyl-ACP methyl ester carboxylesterase
VSAPAHVEIEGARLEVVRHAGDPARSTIVLLHEGLGSVAMWRDFPVRLAQATGAGVVAYSRPGYGRSSPARLPRGVGYMHEEARTVLPRLLDALAIGRPILLGHSDGASIALLRAGDAPDAVAGVVAMAPHLFVEDRSIASIEAARHAWRTTDLPARLARYHDDADAAFRGWNDIWLHPDFRAWNIEEAVARVRAPILAIQGRDDEYGTMAQLDRIAALRPATELLKLDDCRHSPHRDRPDAVLAAVTRFASAADRHRAGSAGLLAGGRAKVVPEEPHR